VRKRTRFFLSVALPLAPRSGAPLAGRGKRNRASWLDIQEPTHAPLPPPPSHRMVAIDPGVRTFATLYDPSGILVEWAPRDIRRIFNLCLYMDKLQSRIAAKHLRCRKRQRMRDRVRHLVIEVHRKLAKFLCENYNVVLYPKYEASSMVCRGRRKIRSKTARQLLCWAPYSFKQRLLSKALEYPWVQVVECREDYTSKTCGRCGAIHWTLGGNKRFVCPCCAFRIDRDLNGARNILLRWLTEREQ
jgi:putative transposase